MCEPEPTSTNVRGGLGEPSYQIMGDPARETCSPAGGGWTPSKEWRILAQFGAGKEARTAPSRHALQGNQGQAQALARR